MNWWTLQQLKFKNPQTRRQAIDKLAAQPPSDAVPGLLSAIEDEAPEVRVAAVHALGRFQEEGVVPALIGLLRDPEAQVR